MYSSFATPVAASWRIAEHHMIRQFESTSFGQLDWVRLRAQRKDMSKLMPIKAARHAKGGAVDAAGDTP
jgi:hypothetical protein